jgi:O-antigen/teichoic acid export membrane protein
LLDAALNRVKSLPRTRVPLIAIRKQSSRAANYILGGGLGPFLIRAVAGTGAVQIAGMLATFLVGVQLARGLGVEGYGQYGLAMAVITLASIPGEFGLPQLVTREVAAASARQDDRRMFGVLRWADRTAILFALLAAGTLALIAYLFVGSDSPVSLAIMIGAPMIPLIALAKVRAAALQGLHLVALGQLPAVLLRPLLFSFLLLFLFTQWPAAGPIRAMLLNVATAVAVLLLAHLLLRRRLPNERPAEPVQAGRQWLASSFPMALTEGMRVMQWQMTVLLLGIVTTDAEVGLYRVAISIVVAIAVPIGLINAVVAPVLARLHANGDKDRMRLVSHRAALAMTLGVLALTLPFILFGSPLLAVVFGDNFAPAFRALLVLSLGQVLSAAFGPNAILLNMSGHEKRVTRAMLFALLVNVALVFLLTPSMGHIGAAWASSAAMLVWNLLAWWDARALLKVNTSVLPSIRWRSRNEGEA